MIYEAIVLGTEQHPVSRKVLDKNYLKDYIEAPTNTPLPQTEVHFVSRKATTSVELLIGYTHHNAWNGGRCDCPECTEKRASKS